MVQQTIYGGKKICGKHQSKEAWDDGHEDAYPGYEGVVQPNDKGECSRPNFKLCPYESLENPTEMVCIREEVPFSECPILWIQILTEDQAKFITFPKTSQDFI